MPFTIKILFMFSLLYLSSCQSAYRVKPDGLAREIDKRSEYILASQQGIHQLTDLYENHRGLVLIFWQSSCACVKRYQARINHLFTKYGPQGVAFMHVSSNTDESFEKAQAEYSKRQSPLPFMRDEGGRLARALGAKGTPVAVLIDPQGNAVFMGWIDDERRPGERGRRAYLDDALKQYLAGEPISVATSPMFGCPIR